jgi:hypothetical protein
MLMKFPVVCIILVFEPATNVSACESKSQWLDAVAAIVMQWTRYRNRLIMKRLIMGNWSIETMDALAS